MQLSNKALLYSALIFPGGGHFLLRRYVPGSLLAGVAFACLVVLVMHAIEAAQKVSEQILLGEIPLDIGLIREAVTTQAAAAETPADTAQYQEVGELALKRQKRPDEATALEKILEVLREHAPQYYDNDEDDK